MAAEAMAKESLAGVRGAARRRLELHRARIRLCREHSLGVHCMANVKTLAELAARAADQADEHNALQWPRSSAVEYQIVQALELITDVLIALLAEAQRPKRAPRNKTPPPAND
jgi:hypothetical protein